MPIHDWTKATAGDFHHFHQAWITRLARALNEGLMPRGVVALAEQITGRPVPDVVTLQARDQIDFTGGIATAAPAKARVVQRLESVHYAKRKDRVVIRHGRGPVLAIIELVYPGNKSSRNAIRSFVEKASDILAQGINLLVVDLFPPTPRDPKGIHQAIIEDFADESFDFLPEKPLTVASYIGGDLPTAYVDSLAVGDRLPDSPLFLTDFEHINCPLESTYLEAWADVPDILKEDIFGITAP